MSSSGSRCSCCASAADQADRQADHRGRIALMAKKTPSNVIARSAPASSTKPSSTKPPPTKPPPARGAQPHPLVRLMAEILQHQECDVIHVSKPGFVLKLERRSAAR